MIPFTKYQSGGNQYVVVNAEDVKQRDCGALAKHICNPHTGVGGDGLIVADQNPFMMTTYECDGGVATTYGNDAHCFAHYVYEQGWTHNNEFEVRSCAGVIRVRITKTDPFKVNVEMGTPHFDIDDLKLSQYQFDVKEYQVEEYTVGSVYFNGIHTILVVDSLDSTDLDKIGTVLANHTLYKEKTVINFVEIMGESNIRVMTYVPNSGFATVNCDGCCASVALLNDFAKVKNIVNVHLRYGVLRIHCDHDVVMLETAVKKSAAGMCSTDKEE